MICSEHSIDASVTIARRRSRRMSRIDPVWAGVAELSRAFGTRVLTPVDAVEALLDRIKKCNPSLHAFIAVYDVEARLAAEAADKAIRSGHRVGPLHGVPIALKDLVDLEGRVTTAGSKVWADRVSRATAQLDARHARPDGALGRGCRADLPRAERTGSARSADARVDAGRSAPDAPSRRRWASHRRHAGRRTRRRRQGSARRARRVGRCAREARRADRPSGAPASFQRLRG